MRDDYVVIIPTYRRPDRVFTYRTLRRQGYTGRIVLLVDDEDDTVDEYRRRYGDEVVVFSKAAAAGITEVGDNFAGRNSAVYAFNATFGVAAQLGFTYFILLDDDYNRFEFRRDRSGQYCERKIPDLDAVFAIMWEYYRSVPALSIAMAQNGDYVGGRECVRHAANVWNRPSRKVMNSFFCSTQRPFTFLGRLNADVTAALVHGSRGGLFITQGGTSLHQESTQVSAGGMSEIYKDYGTYVKSFYSVMYAPSAVKVSVLRSTHARIHHQVRWRYAAPYILDEVWKKRPEGSEATPDDEVQCDAATT